MRILIVEDETSLSRALKVLFEKNNFSADTVSNGKDALDYLAAGNYDVMVLDLMLPVIDGLTVLKTIRAEKNMIPVIILSAKSEVEDKVKGLDTGANDYLAKPFSTSELLARIRALTRQINSVSSNELSFGNTVLSCDTYELKAPGGKYKLANKEFQMMELLLSNPGRIVSTEKFMEKIWGFDTETEISIVWVYISYLRKKLSSIHSDVQIKASRNLGYSLEKADD